MLLKFKVFLIFLLIIYLVLFYLLTILNQKFKNPIIASPDIGGVARARSYADKLGYDLVIVDKKRKAKC